MRLAALNQESIKLSYVIKTLREEVHSRVKKMLLGQPHSARESASGLFVPLRKDFSELTYVAVGISCKEMNNREGSILSVMQLQNMGIEKKKNDEMKIM